MINWLKSLFASRPPVPRLPGQTLIKFQCDGCMATDWRELDRGEITGRITRRVGAYDCDYYVVMRADGSTFDAYVPYCSPGREEQQRWTENPDEPLVGKMLYLV